MAERGKSLIPVERRPSAVSFPRGLRRQGSWLRTTFPRSKRLRKGEGRRPRRRRRCVRSPRRAGPVADRGGAGRGSRASRVCRSRRRRKQWPSRCCCRRRHRRRPHRHPNPHQHFGRAGRAGAGLGRAAAAHRRRGQDIRRFSRGRWRLARHPRRRVLCAARSQRLRQDHAAAHARRLRDAGRRPHPARRQGHRACAAASSGRST